MKRPRISRGQRVLLLLLAGLVLPTCSGPEEPTDLSLILVTLDTTRADRIGVYGGSAVPTPHFDRIAREGVVFEQAISQVPLTLPAHASIMTGLYPASHGVRHNGLYRLPESETTLAEHLKPLGFDTAAVVASYVLNSGFGLEQGFGVYRDIPLQQSQANERAQRTAGEVNADVFEWLDQRQAPRFFLWVHYYDPHDPYSPPETSDHPLQGEGYDREISYMDASFGDLVERLRRDGILDRSLLVVVGDHGESLGEHGERTHGIFLYRGGVEVPMFIRAPGLLPADTRIEGPVEIVDIAPTVLDILRLPAMERLQGRSLHPRIRRPRAGERRFVFAESLMPRLEFGWSELRMVQDARFKYIEAPRPELYDLHEDPGELRNLADDDPRLVDEMARLLTEWVETSAGDDAAATRTLTPEEEARLRSLGYLGGEFRREETLAGRPDPKDRIEEAARVSDARGLLMTGETARALAVLDTVVERDPENPVARSTRLRALVRLRRLADAEVEALAMLSLAEAEPHAKVELVGSARRALASVYWMRGKKQEAIEQYALAEEAGGPKPVFGNLLLGVAGGPRDVVAIVEQVLESDPRDGMALSARFELQHGRGDREAALRTAELLAEVRDGDTSALVKAARLLQDSGRPASAVACYEAALRRSAPDPDLLGYLGTARLAAGDLDGAEQALIEVLNSRPDDPRAHFFLGNVALLRDDEAAARSWYGQALEREPKWAAPRLNLARFLYARGRSDEAAVLIRDALAHDPGNAEATELLRLVRSRSQDPS